MNNKTKQKQIREEIEYLFKHGNSNPPHSYEHIQGNDSKYANQYTKDVIMAIFAREQEETLRNKIKEFEGNDWGTCDCNVHHELKKFLNDDLTTQLPEEKEV